VIATSFDELWADRDGRPRDASPSGKKTKPPTALAAWVALGLVSKHHNFCTTTRILVH
jgi:hypothetical protein